MGFPYNIEFYGNIVASDDEAVGSSVRLKSGGLETDAQISCQQHMLEDIGEVIEDLKQTNQKIKILERI